MAAKEDYDLISQETKHLVAGFCRQHKSDIVNVIVEIIVKFFFEFGDYFAIVGEGVIISGFYKNRFKYKKLNRSGGKPWGTAYGNIVIDSSKNLIYEWTFKIGHVDTAIGIIAIDNNNPSNFAGSTWNKPRYYGFVNTKYRQDLWTHQIGGGHHDFAGYLKNDIIKMSVNTKKNQISYYRNDEYKGILFGEGCQSIDLSRTRDKIDWSYKYRLVVSLRKLTSTIQLIKFQSFPA